ncbi:MAG: ATP-binding protein [Pseudomonadota bacterium]
MAFVSSQGASMGQTVSRLRPKMGLIAFVGLGVCSLAFGFSDAMLQSALIFFGLVLILAAVWIWAIHGVYRRTEKAAGGAASAFYDTDSCAVIMTTADGQVSYRNAAARRLLSQEDATSLEEALLNLVATPSLIFDPLRVRALQNGADSDEVITRKGHFRINVHLAGDAHLIWRIEDLEGTIKASDEPIPLPKLIVGQSDEVLFMNQAACQLVGERASLLDQIFPKLPLRSGLLNDVNTRDGISECLVVEVETMAERREVFLLPGIAPAEHQPDGWAFFDEIPVPLLKLSPEGKIQLSNRPARDLLGINRLHNKVLFDVMEGLGRSILDWLEDVAAGRGGVRSEFLRVKRDDTELFVQVTLGRVMEEGKTVLIAVLNDATELKSLEAQFTQSQKMQAIGQLAGGVAHDFNNLLTAITGHCDLLLLRHDQGDTDYADLIQINQNANRAAALVSQLLAYSRKQTLRPEVMDLRDMMSDLTHLLNRLVGEKVMLSLSHDPLLWSIKADKRQLEQVLMNLVVNARDAMPEGGEIRIETENLEIDAPLRRDRAMVPPGRYVQVTVEDEGVGIPADKLQKVFEPFYTTKRTGEGTGLGLSTVYGIVKQTGGFIFIDSWPDEGATFQLFFPAHEIEVQAQKPAPQVKKLEAQTEGVVLLVEDEAPVRAFASRALQMRGLKVMEADSAEAALDLLSEEAVKIDVFVSDVVMPGIDGPSWVLQALEQRPDTKVVFVSGYAEETFDEIRTKIPNSVFLPKPFSLTELTDTVQQQLVTA